MRVALSLATAAFALGAGIAALSTGSVLRSVLAGGAAAAFMLWALSTLGERPLAPADRVTLVRVWLGSACAAWAVLVLLGAPAQHWVPFAFGLVAWLLDGVDGPVARRTGTASADGAELDMQSDARLLLVLSIVAAPLAWWALGIGLMRYAYVAAMRWRPRLRGALAFSQFRRVVAALQGAALVLAVAPPTPLWLARAAISVALVLLAVSFGRDALTLERRP